jgi:hypothetical protein
MYFDCEGNRNIVFRGPFLSNNFFLPASFILIYIFVIDAAISSAEYNSVDRKETEVIQFVLSKLVIAELVDSVPVS